VLARCGVAVPMSDLFGLEGVALLERVTLPAVYRASWAGLTPRHRESDTHVRSPPANNSSWSTTGYATTRSAHRCTTHRPQHRRHEQPESPPIGAGRAGHDPRKPAWSPPLIDPADRKCRTASCRSSQRRNDRQPQPAHRREPGAEEGHAPAPAPKGHPPPTSPLTAACAQRRRHPGPPAAPRSGFARAWTPTPTSARPPAAGEAPHEKERGLDRPRSFRNDLQQEHRAPQAPRDQSRTIRVDSLRGTAPAVAAPFEGSRLSCRSSDLRPREHAHRGQRRLACADAGSWTHACLQAITRFCSSPPISVSGRLVSRGTRAKSNAITRHERKWKAQRRAKLFCVRVRRSVGQSSSTCRPKAIESLTARRPVLGMINWVG
jgi:hypothetical protein